MLFKGLIQIVLLFGTLLLAAIDAVAVDAPAPQSTSASQNQEEPIDITADRVEQIGEKNLIKAYGHVVIRQKGDRTIKADEVVINTENGMGTAIGHVHIKDPETDLRAERSQFNYKNSQGRMFGAKGSVAKQYLIKGEEFTRLSETHYKAKNTWMTTCRGKVPDWSIHADEADLKVKDRALFTGAVVKVRNQTVGYIPWGYVPLDNERKSGFLMPTYGNSSINGTTVNPSYFWAINQQSDATVTVDYMEKRGVRPNLEYRYTPSKFTRGEFHGNFLQDKVTDNLFYKVDWRHNQVIPEHNIRINGQLDMMGSNNPDKTFNDNTAFRTRQSTDSFLTVNKGWAGSSLDFLTRMRKSAVDERDDTLGILPQLNYRTQRTRLGESNFYFNQNTSYAGFMVDLDPTTFSDKMYNVQRFDFHPQLAGTFNPTPWLAFTQTVGGRETFYTKGIDTENREQNMFSRKLMDFQSDFEGPKFNRIFETGNERIPKINHVVEPRLTYDFIPDLDPDNRKKIKVLDPVDLVNPVNRVTYSITQRLLQKEVRSEEDIRTSQILRLEVRQSFDLDKANSSTVQAGDTALPFSDLRFDLNSRIIDPLMINYNTTYDVRTGDWRTANVQMGVRPWKNLSFYLERRYTLNTSTFYMGTIDMMLGKGWRLTYSSRYDAFNERFQESDFSVRFDDKCYCWGFSADLIQRNNINASINQTETKFMFNLILRGLGNFGSNNREALMHRYFY